MYHASNVLTSFPYIRLGKTTDNLKVLHARSCGRKIVGRFVIPYNILEKDLNLAKLANTEIQKMLSIRPY